MTQYRLLAHQEVVRQLATLRRAVATQQQGGLRDRELRGLELGLRALANGQEQQFFGKRLGYRIYDLSDCAEIKLSVIPESHGNRELGPSHRLVYREFEADDGGPPYREVISFEPRKDDRPFDVAAARLGRARGVKLSMSNPIVSTIPAAPIRQPLPPDLRVALAAASNVADARGAVTAPRSIQQPSSGRSGGPARPRALTKRRCRLVEPIANLSPHGRHLRQRPHLNAGHFRRHGSPDLLVDNLRAFFRQVR